jgi:hypothetical protein
VGALGALTTPAAAAPIEGKLEIVGTANFSGTDIDFLGGGEGTGGFITVEGGTGYFATIASADPATPYTGVAKDLTSSSTNVADFLSSFTAPTYGGLTIDLDEIVAPTAPACTGSEAANSSCSLGYLTLTNLGSDQTALGLIVRGSAEDTAIADSLNDIVGRYTSQTGQTIPQIMAAFADNGITASYSASFDTAVPEPGLLTLLGIGLAATGALRRNLARS